MNNFKNYQLLQLKFMLEEFERKLREKYKYSQSQETTWKEARDMYYEIRNEYLIVDLMEIEDE